MASEVTRGIKGQDRMGSQVREPEKPKETSEKNSPEDLWEIKLVTRF